MVTTTHVRRKSAAITAQNTFSEALPLQSGEKCSISISGTFSATVSLQRRFDGADGSWNDVATPEGDAGWTVPVESTYEADENCEVRLGVKTSNYTSGTANVRLGK